MKTAATHFIWWSTRDSPLRDRTAVYGDALRGIRRTNRSGRTNRTRCSTAAYEQRPCGRGSHLKFQQNKKATFRQPFCFVEHKGFEPSTPTLRT